MFYVVLGGMTVLEDGSLAYFRKKVIGNQAPEVHTIPKYGFRRPILSFFLLFK